MCDGQIIKGEGCDPEMWDPAETTSMPLWQKEIMEGLRSKREPMVCFFSTRTGGDDYFKRLWEKSFDEQ